VIAARINPGLVVVAIVAGVIAGLLILQVVPNRGAATASVPATPTTPSLPPAAGVSSAQSLSGIARVIDGDSIDLRGTQIRLNGIDAPEMKQMCQANGQSYACGEQSAQALIGFLGGRSVECTKKGEDRYHRIVAQCQVGGTDVGAWMVEHGWAVAYRKNGGRPLPRIVDNPGYWPPTIGMATAELRTVGVLRTRVAQGTLKPSRAS
jgi:endonuclease YncB( thermonuclease family)